MEYSRNGKKLTERMMRMRCSRDLRCLTSTPISNDKIDIFYAKYQQLMFCSMHNEKTDKISFVGPLAQYGPFQHNRIYVYTVSNLSTGTWTFRVENFPAESVQSCWNHVSERFQINYFFSPKKSSRFYFIRREIDVSHFADN